MTRGGYSLIELTVSLVILGVLLTAMGSAVALASRALPSPNSVEFATDAAADGLQIFRDDVRYAAQLGSITPGARSIALLLPDRNGDGAPERVVYAWSGTQGAPLTRAYNGSPPVALVPDVRGFSITPQIRVVTESYPGPIVEESERVISSHTNVTATADSFDLQRSEWIGQTFTPQNVPAGAVGWRPTQVSLRAMADGVQLHEGAEITIRDADADLKPASVVRAVGHLPEVGLSANQYRWEATSLTGSVLPANKPYSLVVKWESAQPLVDGVAMKVQFESAPNAGASNLLRTWGNGWFHDPTLGLLYEVKGRFHVRRPDQLLDRTYITGLHATVACGPANTPEQQLTAGALNMPEVLDASWKTDFNGNPTQRDENGDGVIDWVVSSGLGISPSSLADGILQWMGTLESRPEHNFHLPTTIEARLRTTASSDTALWINADAGADGASAPIGVRLRRMGSEQTLELCNQTSILTTRVLETVTALADDFIRVRVTIDPGRDTVNLAVNGRYIGTYEYARFVPLLPAARCVSLASDSGSQWDWVDVRVGGQSR